MDSRLQLGTSHTARWYNLESNKVICKDVDSSSKRLYRDSHNVIDERTLSFIEKRMMSFT